ncbi:phage distal tail protein, Rcc01695 family [Aminobacter sp. LjRoot7]|uniref:phage distal tail protein, Rcc01695 family n=1 Tax=Aminobacter sp. LjRoot7 TaxID=3342335 RepID=UPI003ECD88FD
MTEFSSFHDEVFPLAVSFGATGGPERRNEIVSLTSGREKRNLRFSQSRHHYDAGTGVKSLDDLHDVLAFFEARRGSLHAFRFRDPFDMKSCRPSEVPGMLDQVLGAGDGLKARFSLTKTYGSGADAYKRLIVKPVAASLRIAVAGVARLAPAFSFDDGTGDVVFAAGSIPAMGAQVTAGFEFHVPVRFDAERLSLRVTAFKAGQIPSIPLVEVRL